MPQQIPPLARIERRLRAFAQKGLIGYLPQTPSRPYPFVLSLSKPCTHAASPGFDGLSPNGWCGVGAVGLVRCKVARVCIPPTVHAEVLSKRCAGSTPLPSPLPQGERGCGCCALGNG